MVEKQSLSLWGKQLVVEWNEKHRSPLVYATFKSTSRHNTKKKSIKINKSQKYHKNMTIGIWLLTTLSLVQCEKGKNTSL